LISLSQKKNSVKLKCVKLTSAYFPVFEIQISSIFKRLNKHSKRESKVTYLFLEYTHYYTIYNIYYGCPYIVYINPPKYTFLHLYAWYHRKVSNFWVQFWFHRKICVPHLFEVLQVKKTEVAIFDFKNPIRPILFTYFFG